MIKYIYIQILFFCLLTWNATINAQSVQASIGQGSTTNNTVSFYIQSPRAVKGALIQFHASFAIPVTAVTSALKPILAINNTGLSGVLLLQTRATVKGTSHFIYTYILTGTNNNFFLPANTFTKAIEVRFDGCTGNCLTAVKAVALDDSSHPQHYFYMNVGGIEQMNFDAPFFDNGVETDAPVNKGTRCSSGYGCGSFVSKSSIQTFSLKSSSDADRLQVTPAQAVDSYGEAIINNTSHHLQTLAEEASTAYYNLKLYPNPTANHQVTLEVASAMDYSQVEIVVTDAVGRIVSRQIKALSKGANQLTVSIADLAIGFYFIQLEGADRT